MSSSFFGSDFIFLYSYLPIVVVATTVLAVGIITLVKNRFTGLYLSFLMFTVFVAAWIYTLVILLAQTSESSASLWGQIILILMGLVPPNLYLFTSFLNKIQDQEAPYLVASYLGTIIVGLLILFTPYITDGTYQYRWGYYPRFGQLYYLYFFVFLGTLVKIIHVFIQGLTHENTTEVQVQRNKTLLYGTSIGYFGMVDFLPSFGLPVFPFGYIFVLGGIIIYAWAIWEYRLSGLTDDLLASEIFMTMDEAVVVTDLNGTIDLANEKAVDLLGATDESIQNRNITEFLKEDDLFDRITQTLVDSDEFTGEYVLVDDNQSQYTVRLRVSSIVTGGSNSNNREKLLFVAQDITQLRETESKLNRLTYQNEVTGLPNNRLLERQLNDDEIPRTCESSAYFIVQDIKDLETRMMEEEYRELVQSISNRIESIVPSENLYQHEINEFFVFDSQSEDLDTTIEENLQHLRESIEINGQTFYVNFSIGFTGQQKISTAIDHSREAAVDVLHESGTATSHYSQEKSEENKRFFDLKHDILRGIQEDQITINFHPQMKDGDIRGAEVLVRWHHEKYGFVAPPKIIQAAVEMDQEGKLLEHILSTAFEKAQNWATNQVISFNLAAKQLQYEERLLETISKTTNQFNIPLEQLEMELTEQAAVQNIGDTSLLLKELRNRGLSIAIDDFGTGFSSLKSLIQLPIDYLKIDKSFVLNLHENQKNKEIVETTIELAQNLDLEVIAEGVETDEHIEYLEKNGCDILQGFYWTSPLPPDEYNEFLNEFEGKYAD